MKPLDASDFRARRLILERRDFAVSTGRYPGPTDLINRSTWRSIVGLPDDVSIRTSDMYGSELKRISEYCNMWTRVGLGIQALRGSPAQSSTAIAACDASDEFQAATYCALVGYYRVAFSCLRNALEQVTIATQLAIAKNATDFADWRNGEERIKFGWAADMLPKNPGVAALERHIKEGTNDSLFDPAPKGFVRRLFAELSKYAHGASGFADADARKSNGPIFVPKSFFAWYLESLKTFTIIIHEIKLAHPGLDKLPWGPPPLRLEDLRSQVVADILSADGGASFFKVLSDFWPPPTRPRYR